MVLKRLRKAEGITAREVANRIGMSWGVYYNMTDVVKEEMRYIRFPNIHKLSSYYGEVVWKLFGFDTVGQRALREEFSRRMNREVSSV